MPFAEDAVEAPAKAQLEIFLDQHRLMLTACLDGLDEEQARRRLVPSATTLLGLVKHATFVERVWFDEAITCRSRQEIGLESGPEESFALHPGDTVASVQATHLAACAASRGATADLDLDDLVHGNRRGPLPLRWVYLHVLRELAHHCGHTDILREQLLATPAGPVPGEPAGDR
ncbi:DinB family protein [uncultured Pseudokineococcus sp.]|uniref:DinB family protein n=1 Tax=uncultured Pseudokineococcus sp. TaxID=1642928 RepID=UPI0034462F2E